MKMIPRLCQRVLNPLRSDLLSAEVSQAAILRHNSGYKWGGSSKYAPDTTSIHPSNLVEAATSKNEEVRLKRSRIFSDEQKRQRDLIPRMEKISVKYAGPPNNEEPIQLLMNKDISTPFHCAQHSSEMLIQRSALAKVNGKLWDMHRPISEECELELLHFHDDNPFQVNKAFWRSCSFMLGSVLETIFSDEHFVELHSFPPPNVASGSFVYDADLNFPDWNPTKTELMAFSAAMHRLSEKALPFERLDVSADIAKVMFEDNKHKLKQIPSIAAGSKDGSTITMYRLGDHVDISRGPMVGDSSFLGRRCTITAAHPISKDGVPMYRFQGIALPKEMFLNHFAYGILEKRATLLNEANLETPTTISSE